MTVKILQGDALEVTRSLPDASADLCLTSPPYYLLRDYDHPGQWGSERTVGEYLDHLWALYDQVYRVLKPSGVCFVNLGDSYQTDPGGQNGTVRTGNAHGISAKAMAANKAAGRQHRRHAVDVPRKSLMLIPERFAIGMVERGWVCRNKIAWFKPNAMPSSVRDRFACSWEHVWFFTKRPRYWSDLDAVRVPHSSATIQRIMQAGVHSQHGGPKSAASSNVAVPNGQAVRNLAAKYGNLPGGRLDGVEAGKPFCDRYFGSVAERLGAAIDDSRPQGRRALELAELHGLTAAHIAAIRATGMTDAGKTQVTQTGTGRNAQEVQRLAAEAKAALGGYFREFTYDQTLGRNPGDMWDINTQAWPLAHFAVWPEELARKLLQFGCPLRVCPTCKRPWERVSTRRVRPVEAFDRSKGNAKVPGAPPQQSGWFWEPPETTQHGWAPVCTCPPAPPEAGWAYDPFGGSGTTGVVASRLGVNAILCELNPEYVAMARRRIEHDAPLFADVSVADPQVERSMGQLPLFAATPEGDPKL